MKRFGLVSVIGILLILGGALMINYWGYQKNGVTIGPPEGYSTAEDMIRQKGLRVKKLDIERRVFKYYGDILEVVAFAPGSGWIKIKTNDEISPILSFNHVSHKDIQQFNQFLQSLGLPIRTEFSDNVLRLTLEKTDKRFIVVTDTKGRKTDTLTEKDFIKQKGFWQPEQPPRLVIRKDKDGKVFLVAREQPSTVAKRQD